jgi:hypothetical protein
MTQRRWALRCGLLVTMALAEHARAGVWGMDPVLGVLGDYSTDPALLHQPDAEVGSGAVQVDLPTTYVADGFKLAVQPSFRVGDSHGYSSVASDYEHLNIVSEYDTELSSLTATGALNRDSSLSYNYLANGSAGVRRDGGTADLNWDLHLSERLELGTDANTQRVLYAEPFGVATLTDYNYSSVAPVLSWASSERNKVTLSSSVGRYDSLNSRDAQDQPTSSVSRSVNLQLGFVRQLSEEWTLTATGGFSRALNAINLNEYVCCTVVNTPQGPAFELEAIPVKAESAQNGSVYMLSLTHQGEQLSLNAVASRQLTPTGFAFLSQLNNYELKAAYTLSERWSFSGDARLQTYQNPPVNGTVPRVTVQYYALAANWSWTEHLTLSLSGARVSNNVPASAESTRYSVASNEVTLTLSRKFDHLDF